MKLKKCLILVFFIVGTQAFSITPRQTTILNYSETNIQKLNFTAYEDFTLAKLNSLKTTNKETVLLVLDLLYKKNTEKKFLLEKQKDFED